MEITEIARLFSTGQFSRIEDALAEAAVWEIIGEQRIEGAAAVLKHGRAIEAYFSTVAHEFTVQAVHQCGNTVIVQGQALFRKPDQDSRIAACDIYAFDDARKLMHIQSYCIAEA
ncbi:MAG: nuclear transport factor 2 family protein [Acinetobacter sp.]|nr:nuclear transport factor 2 family protein [Acinetobacter sp.]